MAITAFVVVPSEHFDQVSVNDASHGKLGNAWDRITDDVSGDERIFSNSEDAFPMRIGGRFAQDVVDLFCRSLFL